MTILWRFMDALDFYVVVLSPNPSSGHWCLARRPLWLKSRTYLQAAERQVLPMSSCGRLRHLVGQPSGPVRTVNNIHWLEWSANATRRFTSAEWGHNGQWCTKYKRNRYMVPGQGTGSSSLKVIEGDSYHGLLQSSLSQCMDSSRDTVSMSTGLGTRSSSAFGFTCYGILDSWPCTSSRVILRVSECVQVPYLMVGAACWTSVGLWRSLV